METLKESRSYKTRIILILTGIVFIAAALVIGLTDNLPAITLFLAGAFIFFFGIFFRAGKSKNLSLGIKLLYWAPRLLCIVFVFFTSLFALDVFENSKGFWETALALIMHLIPSFLMAAILIISWKREWIGAVLFIVLAIVYIIITAAKLSIGVYFLIAGPLFLIGLLFFFNWKYKSLVRPQG